MGDGGEGVMSNLKPQRWRGQYGFVEHVSNWEVQRPVYEEEPRKR